MSAIKYNVGDLVRIVTPKFVKRVGYPLVFTDLLEEVAADPRTLAAFEVLKDQKPSYLFKTPFTASDHPFGRDLVAAIAKMRVEERGFGGNERSLHYYPKEEAPEGEIVHGPRAGRCYPVEGKRVVKTGTRYPSRSCGPDDDHWEEPGGLADCKTHVLLRVAGGFEIERTNVELVRRRS